VVRAVADDPLGPFVFADVVLPARGPEHWDGCATHNPAIVRAGDEYALFYTGITYPFADVTPENTRVEDERYILAQSRKRIGVAFAPNPEGPWTRLDAPVLPTRPGLFDAFLTSNAAPCVSPDGAVTLVYKGREQTGSGMGKMALGVAMAPCFRGPFSRRPALPILRDLRGPAGDHGRVEDPFLWRDQAGLFHLIAKDMTGAICGEPCGGLHAVSVDAIDWQVRLGERSYSRTVAWSDGSTRRMGAFERPFVLLEDGWPRVLYGATGDGPGGFSRATETWNVAVPLARGTGA
jgi:hypothetical protein